MTIPLSQQLREFFTAIGSVTIFLIICVIIAKVTYAFTKRKNK